MSTDQLDQRIGKVQGEIDNLKQKLPKLHNDKEQLLINAESVSDVNAKISGIQTEIVDKQLLVSALERKKVEAQALEEQQEKQAKIKKLQAEASQLEKDAVKCIGELVEEWEKLKPVIEGIEGIRIRAREIRQRAQQLHANITMNLPELSLPISFGRSVVHNPMTSAFMERVRKQIKEG